MAASLLDVFENGSMVLLAEGKAAPRALLGAPKGSEVVREATGAGPVGAPNKISAVLAVLTVSKGDAPDTILALPLKTGPLEEVRRRSG